MQDLRGELRSDFLIGDSLQVVNIGLVIEIFYISLSLGMIFWREKWHRFEVSKMV